MSGEAKYHLAFLFHPKRKTNLRKEFILSVHRVFETVPAIKEICHLGVGEKVHYLYFKFGWTAHLTTT